MNKYIQIFRLLNLEQKELSAGQVFRLKNKNCSIQSTKVYFERLLCAKQYFGGCGLEQSGLFATNLLEGGDGQQTIANIVSNKCSEEKQIQGAENDGEREGIGSPVLLHGSFKGAVRL